jgi:uncharacterized protein YukE
MGIFDFVEKLLSFARSVVDGVLGQITSQLNFVNDSALAPINSMVDAVTGGVWRGKGADAFVAEMKGSVIPEIGSITGSIGSIGGAIRKGEEIIEQADNAVAGIINGLGDIFGNIF